MSSLDVVIRPHGRMVSDDATDVTSGSQNSDTPVEDKLDRSEYADQIARLILDAKSSFTVAVYGRWGEGKTHLLRSVQGRVRVGGGGNGSSTTQIHTVWFDPWQHQRDVNPPLAMLQTARDQIVQDKTKRQVVSARFKDVGKSLLLAGIDVAVSSAAPITGLFGTKLSPQSIRVAYERQREAQLTSAIDLSEEQTKLRVNFHKALDELAGNGRVVFFIDDLDRCLPDRVVELLEQIKLFMDHPKCVFVIAADEKAVVRAIHNYGNYSDPGVAEHYLEKMVLYSFDLPPVAHDVLNDYIVDLLKQTVGDTEEWIDRFYPIAVLWKQAFDDPDVGASIRLIKRTVNTFSVDCGIGWSRLGVDKFDPLIMAVLSAIKTCYREVFDQLRQRPEQRVQDLWRQLFDFSYRGTTQLLVSTIFGQGEAEKDAKNDQEPGDGNANLLSHGFVQACQGLMFTELGLKATELTSVSGEKAVVLSQDFPDLVEAHFRLASPDSVALGSRSSQVGVEVVITGGTEPMSATSTEEGARPRPPIQTLDRLPGLVDYFTRRTSAQEEVDAAVERIRLQPLNDDSQAVGVVRLSGIDWRILESPKRNKEIPLATEFNAPSSEVLLLADRVVGTGPYNKAQLGIDWQRCDLRRWLNGPFLESLGEPLRARINRTPVSNEENPIWRTPGGEATSDSVFLLSMQQAVGYLTGKWDVDWLHYKDGGWLSDTRLGASSEDGKDVWWWLRSPGGRSDGAARVGTGGIVRSSGSPVSTVSGGVRPAFRLNLE